nr:SIR2 family protein [Bifidobacterium sp. ESL0784]
MSFDWVLTTNYDSVIESLMPGSTLTLLPEEKFVKTRNLTPVCHLHGSVTDPQSIVITDEDYTRFFRAGNYWQSRLSFLAKEHVMLMVGYGLGDSDVISAIDWCGSVYKDRETKGYDCPIIQIHFERSKPKTDPYIRKYGGSDVYVLDVESLESFTDELEDAQGESKQRVAVVEKEISALNSYFAGFNGDNNRFKINSFITNRDERQEKLKIINTLDPEYGDKIWPSFLKFFKKELDKVHNFSREDNHFGGYDYWLQMIIDVLCIIDFRKLPPSFFHEICESFDEVMRWIDSGSGYSYGYSWDATGTWKREKSNIPVVAMTQLKLFCIANGLINSKGLL